MGSQIDVPKMKIVFPNQSDYVSLASESKKNDTKTRSNI